MGLWSKLKDLLIVNDSIMDETFSLGEREIEEDQEEDKEKDQGNKAKGKEAKEEKSEGGFKKPHKLGENPDKGEEKRKKENEPENQLDQHIDLEKLEFSEDIEENKAVIKKAFRMPLNKDAVIREFTISFEPEIKAFLFYIDGLTSKDTTNLAILEPLMHLSKIFKPEEDQKPHEVVYQEMLPSNQVEKKDKVKDIVEGALGGQTALFMDGYAGAMLFETRAMPSRSVSTPTTEMSIRGPQEAFTEQFRVNTALIRKYLRSERLITEMTKVGDVTRTDVAIFYLDGVVNPKLVREVKRRLKAIKVDNAVDSGTVEQLIQDNPMSMVPGIISTERPDRVCSFLMEGHVALVIGGNPFVLVVPITFWALLHTTEDYSLGWPFGAFLRFVRTGAFFVALLTPALYIAVSNYHPEMIPTDLLLAAAAAREKVPFPAIVEVLLMELSFELIREAGTRTPSVIGNTIGIVGALILGQAAVTAGIVSPLLVIIVALTALGSFAIPNYAFSFGIRIMRFFFILAASVLGFYGIALVLFVYTVHLCGQKAFGVPIMSPVAPYRPPSKDIIIRYPLSLFNLRPGYMRTGDRLRQKPVSRAWDPVNEDMKQNPEQIPGIKEAKSQNDKKGKGGKGK